MIPASLSSFCTDPKKGKVGSCVNHYGLMPEQGMKEGS